MFRGHTTSLLFENLPRPHSKNQNRHCKKADSGYTGYEIGHSESPPGMVARRTHVSSETAAARRGATSFTGCSPIVCRIASRPAPRLPVVRLTKSATKPAVIGIAESARINQ